MLHSPYPPSPKGDGVLSHAGGFAQHPDAMKLQEVDDWLPVTGSRNAVWWHSAFHNVTAMVGAGVLGLPAAMVYLGWEAGIVVLVGSWMITLYTLWQMVEMHEMVPGKRFDRYHELGQEAFGPKLGLWIVVPQQLVVEVGANIVYMVAGGESLEKFYSLIHCPKDSVDDSDLRCGSIGKSAWIVIFASQHFFLAQLPNFNSIARVSLAAALMSLSYSTIAWIAPLHPEGKFNRVGSFSPPDESTSTLIFGVFNALGNVAFAYAGHNVVLEIQATIPSTPEKPSKIAMWRGVIVAYIIVAMCYFPVAIVGYWAFGNKVKHNILLSLGKPRWIIAMANMMVVIHVTGSYQLYAMPVFDMIETILVKKIRLRPSLLLRIVIRSVYVGFTAFVACSIPFFGALLGFLGGFAFAPTTFFLPCIMWLVIYKPKRWGFSWLANSFCISTGALLMLTSCIGGLHSLIKHASNFDFYE